MPYTTHPQTAVRIGRGAVAVTACWGLALAVNRSLRRVRGGSMTPTLLDGDLVLTLPTRHPRRGHVVLLRDPRNTQHRQVKRVLGLPGESLRSINGRLLVDGVGQLEPYASGRGPDGALTVPPAHIGVLGDARGASTDSRVYGAVPLALVDARVVARVLPSPKLLLGGGPTPLRVARSGGGRAGRSAALLGLCLLAATGEVSERRDAQRMLLSLYRAPLQPLLRFGNEPADGWVGRAGTLTATP